MHHVLYAYHVDTSDCTFALSYVVSSPDLPPGERVRADDVTGHDAR